MTSALVRGRTLDPDAVELAKEWRKGRVKELEAMPILALTFKERHELLNLKPQVEEVDRKEGEHQQLITDLEKRIASGQ